eukprot:TRINITY_DN21188_c0_g1_i2.p3 TRINITY_DN21188_c0_g1~~TRINITY_DN21188_c0_g1_i2.p3  ORF type:complete len:111 (+),score=8.26 TRINITY_DN21188_c0_g1_i2:1-333(+)
MQRYRPSPFVVLDEVDAALDPKNVLSLARYLRKVPFQCVVISLKDSLFSQCDGLVGVFKDRVTQSSGCLTLDLTQYDLDVDVLPSVRRTSSSLRKRKQPSESVPPPAPSS